MHASSLDASTGATHALVLAVAAGVEGLTGLAMLIAPFIVTQLLRGGDIPSVAVGLLRLGAAALLSLAIAAWPAAGSTAQSCRSLPGLLTYNLLTVLLLLFLGIRGVWLGVLLWPAVVLHAFLTVLLARIWASQMAEEQCWDDRGPDSVMIATGATPLRACPGVRTHGLASVAAMPAFSWRLAVADSRCKVKRLN